MDKILVVEDESIMRELLRDNLCFEGYEVLEALNLSTAEKKIEERPDLIILDANLPDGDGISRISKWRGEKILIPIIVCTVKDREIDVVRALDVGADDYVTKPFRIRELLSRIKAILRRRNDKQCSAISVGAVSINFSSRQISSRGGPVSLTATEWTLLDFLVTNLNCVVSREQIIDHVWGVKDLEDSRAVDVHIGRLRKKISDCDPPKYLLTVRGLGYKLNVDR